MGDGGRDGVVNLRGRVGGRGRGLYEGGNFWKALRTFPDSKEADSLARRALVRLSLSERSIRNGGHNLGIPGEGHGPVWVPGVRLKANVGDWRGCFSCGKQGVFRPSSNWLLSEVAAYLTLLSPAFNLLFQ